jgi:hypothetical protein
VTTAAAWRRLAGHLLDRAVLAADEVTDRTAVLGAVDASVAGAREQLIADLATDAPLALLAASARLTSIEVEVLALCVAVDLDPELTRLAHALTGTRALTVAGLSQVLGPYVFDALSYDGSLARAALLEIDPGGPLGSAAVTPPRQVTWFLAGTGRYDSGLHADAEVATVPDALAEGGRRVLVASPDRVRRVQAAMLATAGDAFVVSPPPSGEEQWDALVRHATLAGLGIVLDIDGTELTPQIRQRVVRAMHLNLALVSASPLPLETLPREPWIEAIADPPRATDDEWRSVFGEVPVPSRRPSASQLRALAPLRATGSDAASSLHRLASGTLLRHARRVTPTVGWDELILPPAQERRLRQLVDRYRFRDRVHEQWKLPAFPSPGVVALFSGPSGTGKTTAAEVIAGDLGVDLFRVDLAALVSKYIGETEKNLEEVFSAAHAGSYVLLFDEADSLFGSRSTVTDARDRYANMEVSYLLQRLETYDGFVILTSNFQGNIDQAFLRRIHATVNFTLSNASDRAAIWRRCLASAPVDDLDIEFVAEQFDLAGGAIRNASLTAAFFAAARNETVGMVDVLRAVSQELTKLGRRPQDSQFGRWAAEVGTAS